jgi:2-polyprenyl-3-methyl-5-hydroxy-6-metoxy-1,4-benzoquinol methylase
MMSMHPRPPSFAVYKQQAVQFAQKILRASSPGEYDEQALPAYSHRNRLMRWLFWQRLRRVVRYLERKAPAGARVLDFGCGVGMLLPLLAWRGFQVTGVDLDIRHTESFLAAFGISGVTILSASKLNELPSGQFDIITALDVLEHVPELDQTIVRLGNLLKPGGKLVVCGPTENALYRLGRRLAGFSGAYHLRNIEDIRQAVHKHFTTVSLGTIYPWLPLFKLFEATRLPDFRSE